jgi:hypothetical protein
MGSALKQANKWALAGVVVINLALFLALLNGTVADWTSLSSTLLRALPAGVGVALIGVLNAQFTAETKARLVFMRWRNPLPASRAFSHYVHQDPRINLRRLAEIIGPFPTDPKEQNARWYGLYTSLKDDPSVIQVHREYLFTRDYACLAAMMFVLLTPLGFFTFPAWRLALAFLGAVLIQFLLASRAARHHGIRFVTTVLALKSSE